MGRARPCRLAWGALGLVAAAACAGAATLRRAEVAGSSMAPALEPGDRLVVVRLAPFVALRRGDVVAVRDPRRPSRLLVKRVDSVSGDRVDVVGDNAAASTDSRSFGALARRAVWGLAVHRYAPPSRSGRIRRGPRGDTGLSAGWPARSGASR